MAYQHAKIAKRSADDAFGSSASGSTSSPPQIEFQSGDGNTAQPEIKIETTPTNAQVVKKFYLTDGNVLTVTYHNERSFVMIGHIPNYYLMSDLQGLQQISLAGMHFLTLNRYWYKIKKEIEKKSATKVSIPLSSFRDHFLVFNIGHFASEGYGMKIYYSKGGEDVPEVVTLENECVFLNEESLQKMSRAMYFIKMHLLLLTDNVECYNLMHQEITNYICRFNIIYPPLERCTVGECIEKMVTYDLKKEIIDNFNREVSAKSLTCPFNVYALYSFCLGQVDSISRTISDYYTEVEMLGMCRPE